MCLKCLLSHTSLPTNRLHSVTRHSIHAFKSKSSQNYFIRVCRKTLLVSHTIFSHPMPHGHITHYATNMMWKMYEQY